MKTTTCCWVALAAAIWMLGNSAGLAQTASPVPVAVVDIGEIFKNHPGFNRKIEALRKEVDQWQQSMEKQAQELSRNREALTQTYRPGTPQYKEQEEKLARQQASLTTDAQLQRKEFMDREAQLYLETYQEVQKIIARVAKDANVGLVLRFSRLEMESEDRQSILQGVYRPVVYYDRNLDMTDHIIGLLTSTARQPAAASGDARGARPAAAPPQR